MDLSKIEAVMNWETPTLVIQIKSFLGLAGYCRRFIKGFSQISLPLTKLTRKNAPFVWNADYEKCFQKLKEKLISIPVLVLLDRSGPFESYCDASRRGLCCVLMQSRNVVAYASRQLKSHIISC